MIQAPAISRLECGNPLFPFRYTASASAEPCRRFGDWLSQKRSHYSDFLPASPLSYNTKIAVQEHVLHYLTDLAHRYNPARLLWSEFGRTLRQDTSLWNKFPEPIRPARNDLVTFVKPTSPPDHHVKQRFMLKRCCDLQARRVPCVFRLKCF